MLRLGSFAAVLALATAAFTQGCAASGPEDVIEGNGALSASSAGDKLLDVPFYFSVPKQEVSVALNKTAYSYPTVWNTSIGNPNAGLRVIAIKQPGTSPSQKAVARIEMEKQLGRAGVLQDGDLALTFRPELANTMAYPHIQMGITHTSLVYVKNGEAFHIDSPLDDVTTGDGRFSVEHFVGGSEDHGVDAIQIVRPRGLSDARKVQLRQWIDGVASQRLTIKQQVPFQSDYLTPVFASTKMTTKQTVTTLGKIILRQDKTSKLPVYCSEFAWHLLALSNCSQTDILNAGPEGAACVAPVFEPMPLIGDANQIGLGEGPLRMIETAPQDAWNSLLPTVFKTGNASGLSSGHRAVAKQLEEMGLIAGLEQYYQGKLAGAPADALAGAKAQMNASVTPNYSPTAFMALATQDDAVRPVDYVATVAFFDSDADIAKAKSMAAAGTP